MLDGTLLNFKRVLCVVVGWLVVLRLTRSPMQILYWHVTKPRPTSSTSATANLLAGVSLSSPPLLSRRHEHLMESSSTTSFLLLPSSPAPPTPPPHTSNTSNEDNLILGLPRGDEQEDQDQVDDEEYLRSRRIIQPPQTLQQRHPVIRITRNIPSASHQANNNLNHNSSRRQEIRRYPLPDDEEEDYDDGDPLRTHPVVRKRPKLIINLHESRKGYDVAVSNTMETSDDEDEEDRASLIPLTTHKIPYTENDPFLEALNHSYVPPSVTFEGKLESSSSSTTTTSSLYGPGGTICGQVRDYRRFKEKLKNLEQIARVPQRKNILLKPSPTSLEKDFQSILAQSVVDSMLYNANLLDKTGKDHEDSDYEVESDEGDDSEDEDDDDDDEDTDDDEDEDEYFNNVNEIEDTKRKKPTRLSYDQKLELEKEFINATAGPVCLDPGRDGSVAALENRRQWEGLKWEGTGKKVPKGRKGPCPRAEEISSPIPNSPGAKIQGLLRFIQGVKERVGVLKDRDPFKLPQMANLEYPPLEPPKNMADDISKVFAKCGITLNGPGSGVRPIHYDNTTRKIEEYLFETERRKRPHTTKLTIYQKNGIDSHFGELEIESFGESPSPIVASSSGKQQSSGNHLHNNNLLPTTKCQFELGSFRSVTLYVRQFSDIFTEDGRRPCKIVITRYGPGNSPPQTQIIQTTTYNPNTSSSSSSSGTANTNASSAGVNNNINGTTSNINNININNNNETSSVVGGGGRNVVVKTSQSSTIVAAAAAAAAASASSAGSSSSGTPQHQPQPPTPTTPPVQIVHPQPRSSIVSATTATVASAPTIVVDGQQAQPVVVGASSSSAPTQIPLTRPLQQQLQQQQPQTQVILQAGGQGQTTHIVRPTTAAQQQQLLQQRLLRLKQAQLQQQQQQQQQQIALQQQVTSSSQIPQQQQQQQQQQQTALAKLLLTNVVNTNQSSNQQQQQQQRPITVAVQPQPQKSNENSTPIITSVSSAAAASSLNTITLDGLLAGSTGHQIQSQYVHHIQQQQRQAVNILRGNPTTANNNAAAAAATTLLQRQLAAGNVSIVQSSGGQRILINSGSAAYATAAAAAAAAANNVGATVAVGNQQQQQQQQQVTVQVSNANVNNDIHHHQEIVTHHTHPDLATLLQSSSVAAGGNTTTTTYALDTSHHHHHAIHQTPHHHNVNLNVNVNVNASTGVADSVGGVSAAAAPPPFLVFISPLRSVPVSIATGGTTFHTTATPQQQQAPQQVQVGPTQQSVQVTTTAQIPTVVSNVIQQQQQPQQLNITTSTQQQLQLQSQQQPQQTTLLTAEPQLQQQTVEDTLLNAISDVIGPELSNKIEGLGGTGIGGVGTPNGTTVMIASTPYTLSLAPSSTIATSGPVGVTGETVHQTAVGSKKDGSAITLSDLLGSPGSSSSSGISGEVSSSSSPALSSTPRLSALLAGTPTGGDASGSSLLERLGGSRNPSSSIISSGGLNPIATATPSVVLENPVLAATLTGGTVGGSRSGISGGYRQIAPAPLNHHHHLSHLNHTVVVQSTPQQHPQSSSQSQ